MDRKYVDILEKVGTYKGEDVFLVKSKGGYHCMGLKKSSGRLELMQGGSHRAIARHIADQKFPGIAWDRDKLYKSDLESTPEKHIQLAEHHAKLANKYNHMRGNPEAHASEINSYYKSFTPEHKDFSPFQLNHDISMRHLIHKDIAMKHYQMGGFPREQAAQKVSQAVDHNMSLQSKEPHSESELSNAWGRKHPNLSKPGKGTDWTK